MSGHTPPKKKFEITFPYPLAFSDELREYPKDSEQQSIVCDDSLHAKTSVEDNGIMKIAKCNDRHDSYSIPYLCPCIAVLLYCMLIISYSLLYITLNAWTLVYVGQCACVPCEP